LGFYPDDHARNHAAFWDGTNMSLTPAYDICPQGRSGLEASQTMLITRDKRSSKISTCLETAKNFLLSQDSAKAIFEKQKATINEKWGDICDEADSSEIDRKYLWERQFLNPFATDQA
jgi:serine/threonine-protein kinase HipA